MVPAQSSGSASCTHIILKQVLQFLQHDGYIETARAFAEEIQVEKKALSLDPDKEIQGINVVDDEDANNRQRKLQLLSHFLDLD